MADSAFTAVNDTFEKNNDVNIYNEIDFESIDPKYLYYITDNKTNELIEHKSEGILITDNKTNETNELIEHKSEGILIRVYSGVKYNGEKEYKYAFIRKSPLDLLWQNTSFPILYNKSKNETQTQTQTENLGGKRSRKAKKQRKSRKGKSRSRK